MLRTFFTVAVLFALWYMLSGLVKPLVLYLGMFSAIVAGIFVRRMDAAADHDRLILSLRPVKFILYVFWLFGEIAKSNWSVAKVIMSPDMPIRQHFFDTPYTQKTELGQTIFANSITLTPGTVTVEVEQDVFQVHALEYDAEVPQGLDEMDQRVRGVEFG